jgi:hypothetical protein
LNNIWGIGEVYVLFWELISPQFRCGCGKNLKECPFWKPIITDLSDRIDIKNNISLFRDSWRGGKVIRIKDLFEIFFGWPRFNRKRLKYFCEDNKLFFSVVGKGLEGIKDADYLVDNSKDPYRLFWLIKCSYFDIKVIHIMKDPRAFVYSISETDVNFFVRFKKTIRMSLRYIIENFLIEKVSSKLPAECTLVLRYEDLVVNQPQSLKKICDWLNINYHINEVDLNNVKNHVFGPNTIKGKILLDDKWKTNLSKFNKFLVVLITYFFAKRYGYFKRSTTDFKNGK